jgi:hypothetical protein
LGNVLAEDLFAPQQGEKTFAEDYRRDPEDGFSILDSSENQVNGAR